MTDRVSWTARPFTLEEIAAIVDDRGMFSVSDGDNNRRPRLRLRLRFTDEIPARQLAQYLALRLFVRPGVAERGTVDTFVVETRGLRAQALADEVVDLIADDTRAALTSALDRLDVLRDARQARRESA